MTRFLDYLKEEYLDRVKDPHFGKHTSEVYVNPTRDEVKQLPQYIRFLIDIHGKKIYMWDSYILHRGLEQSYFWPNKLINKPTVGYDFIRGSAANRNGLLGSINMFDYGNEVELEQRREYILKYMKDLSWLDPYFTTKFETIV